MIRGQLPICCHLIVFKCSACLHPYYTSMRSIYPVYHTPYELYILVTALPGYYTLLLLYCQGAVYQVFYTPSLQYTDSETQTVLYSQANICMYVITYVFLFPLLFFFVYCMWITSSHSVIFSHC